MNLVAAATYDLKAAHALLMQRHSPVLGLDVRELRGGSAAFAAADPRSADVYCGAIDAGLRRLRGITNRGYVLYKAKEPHGTETV